MPKEPKVDWAKTGARFTELGKKDRQSITPEEYRELKLAQQNLTARMLEQERANFSISGEVVDEKGTPLSDLQMTITESKPLQWFLQIAKMRCLRMRRQPKWVAEANKACQTQTTATANKTFSVSAKKIGSLRVSFRKDGYFPNGVRFRASLPNGAWKQLLKDGVVEPSEVTKKGIRVVLKEKLDEARLKKVYSYFPVFSTGKLGYFDYDFEFIGAKTNKQRKAMPSKEITTPAKGENIPAGRIWATIPVDPKTGVYAMATYRIPNLRSPGPKLITGLMLHASGKNAGFIRFKPTARPKHQNDAWREMRSAPEQGYRSELTIQAADIPKLYHLAGGAEWCYFYFRSADGKYGKCRVCIGQGSRGGTKIRLHAEFYMQPDGSRNVQTNGEPRT